MLTFQMALILCAYDEKQYTLVMYTKHAMNIRKKNHILMQTSGLMKG